MGPFRVAQCVAQTQSQCARDAVDKPRVVDKTAPLDRPGALGVAGRAAGRACVRTLSKLDPESGEAEWRAGGAESRPSRAAIGAIGLVDPVRVRTAASARQRLAPEVGARVV